MCKIAITQRVDVVVKYGERRDALDQSWISFLSECGCIPLVLPNNLLVVHDMLAVNDIQGVLLTGGNTLASCGGDAPERDEVEKYLLKWALESRIPLLGVCRGMQLIQAECGVSLEAVIGHVMPHQQILVNGEACDLNSYHEWGTRESTGDLIVWAKTSDGVVKAVRHKSEKLAGIMWHPERILPYRSEDIAFVKKFFDCG